jgi:hypothetical protein
MTLPTLRRSLNLAILAIGLSAPVLAQGTPPISGEKSILVSVTAKVQSIDMAARQVTLKGPLGNVVSFTVDTRVTRLNEVKVGDDITADYYVSLAGEVRTPTEQEKANPVTVLSQTAKAPAGTSPAGGVLHVTRAVVTVEGLDRPTKTLTVSGPKGNFFTTEVDSLDKLSKLHLGDVIVVTYTVALAISLEKAAAKK